MRAAVYAHTVAACRQAWAGLPVPHYQSDASLWRLTVEGDARFCASQFADAAQSFRDALTCPRGAGNPYLHLRLGQCEFECGRWQSAAQHLGHAFAVDGADVFAGEEPKYLAFLRAWRAVDACAAPDVARFVKQIQPKFSAEAL